jgi:hypothetical protein
MKMIFPYYIKDELKEGSTPKDVKPKNKTPQIKEAKNWQRVLLQKV